MYKEEIRILKIASRFNKILIFLKSESFQHILKTTKIFFN